MKALIIISMFYLAFIINVSGQNTAQEMLNKAIYEEEVNGNLEEAMKLFIEIVEKNSTNRAITVEAFYHLGLTNEKLGNKKAKEYYEKVVNNFTDQPEFVRIAKERLSKLQVVEKAQEIPLVPKFTKIKIASNPQGGVLSPDGNKLAFLSDGAVWIVPVHGKVNQNIAGEPFRIAEIPDAWDYGSLMSWSVDGKWIAVNGKETDEGTLVYVVQMEGGKSRIVNIPHRGGHSFSYRLSLSPDGQMLAFSGIETGTLQEVQDPHDRRIYTIPIAGGEPKQISSNGARARLPSFSPDGKLIAYVGYKKGNIGELWIAPSSGGKQIKLAEVNGRLRGPVWSSDNKYLAAHHEPGNNNSSNEIIVYPLSSDFSTVGEPKKIMLPGQSYNLLAGWTPEDELGIFIQSEEHSAIYTVPASGGKAVQVSPDGQWPYYPRWSPDGKHIYFRPPFVPNKQGDVENKESPVLYVSATGGIPSGIPVASNQDLTTRVPGGGFNISPNGETIVISTGMEKRKPNEGNLWTISLESGQPTRLTSDRYFDGRYPCWSPDGKWIAFIDDTDTLDENYKESFTAIYIIPAKGGIIRQITSKTDSVGDGAITFSPNGEHIAYFSGGTIKTIPVEGGKSKIIVANIKSFRHSQLAYSPDGSKIAHNTGGKIWITSFDDGIPQELKTGLPQEARQSEFGWSPDSKKIVFFNNIGGKAEFWLVCDFLPLDKLAQNKEKDKKNIVIHKVMDGTGAGYPIGTPSPDGKYLAYVDWSDYPNDIVIEEIGTEKVICLKNQTALNYNGDKGFPYSHIWSPDSKKIAYTWENDDEEFCDLRVIDINNAKAKVLKRVGFFENWLQPLDWSPDGQNILVLYSKKDNDYIGLMSVKDSSFTPLKVLNGSYSNSAKFSPDGNYIAYDLSLNKKSTNHDVYVLSIDGRQETKITVHPSHDYLLDWTPSGEKLLFASDRSGTTDMWSISLDNGIPRGKSKLITKNVGLIEPMGCTKNGSLYYSTPGSWWDIYTVNLNPETGKVDEHPVEVPLPNQGYNLHSAWSPDGKFLAYVSRQHEKSPRSPWIYSVETGLSKKIIYPEDAFFPRWFPDSKSILVSGSDVLDISSGEIKTTLQLKQHEDDEIRSIFISSDNNFIYYTRENRELKLSTVNRKDLKTGEIKELHSTPDDCLSISLSPDNKQLAVQSRHNETTRIIKLMSAETGEAKDIHEFETREYRYISMVWSPNGKYIYFSRGTDAGWELCRIPFSGGEAEDLGVKMHGFGGISMHPDGKQITFFSFVGQQKPGEVWMMENFLPKEETANK